MRGFMFVALCSLLVLLCAGGGYGFQVRSGQIVTIEEGVTVDDDLAVTAEDVEINGTVNGNLIVLARNATIVGQVRGSVIAFGETIECVGPVLGSFHGAGRTIILDSTVARNFMAAGQRISIGDAAVVRRDALAAGDSIRTSGVIGGDLKAGARSAILSGGIGQTARLWVESLSVTDDARIGADLVYVSATAAEIADGAQVMGRIIHRLPKPEPARRPRSLWVLRVFSLIWLLLFTVVLTALLPRHTHEAAERIRAQPLWVLLVGFLALIVMPIVALLLLIPVLPGALMIAAIWLAFLYIAKVVCGVFAGLWIFRVIARREVVRPVLAGLAGVVVIWALGLIPYFGGLLRLAVAVFGFGALSMVIGQRIAGGYRRETA